MATRREFLVGSLSAAAGLAGCSRPGGTGAPASGNRAPTTGGRTTGGAAETGSTGTATPGAADGEDVEAVGLETVTDRPAAPLALAETPGGTVYVADLPGRIHSLRDGSAGIALDMGDAVVTGSERGLLGLALHPEFGSNRRLYVRYSAPPRKDTPASYSHTFVLAEFRARTDGTIDRETERTLLEIPEPQGNHNSGPVAFGPDGYLYVGVGDGGAADDAGRGHVEDWYGPNEGGNGQDVTENLLGSLLRIDVDGRTGDRPYAVPADNPLVGAEGLDEHYAWGLRNPWGISFDARGSGSGPGGADLYVADVGQNRFEEVNRIERGGNYGWNVREGAGCFGTEGCPAAGPDGERLRDPVIEYPHSGAEVSGVAVVGGHVYRGDAVPGLAGTYVFGDLNARGRLFVAEPSGGDGLWPTDVLEIAGSDREKLGSLLMVGRDRSGELYALARSGVHRIVPAG